MKQLLTITIIGILLSGPLSASSSERQSPSICIDRQDIVSVSDFFESVDVILLETTEQSRILSISKIIYFNNRYYIFDGQQQKIFCFDSDGNFLFRISQRGEGPEEYLFLEDFNIDPFNNQLLLLEPFGRLFVFDLDGNFISVTRLPSEVRAYNEVFAIDENRLLFSSLYTFGFIFYDRATNTIIEQRHYVQNMALRLPDFPPLYRVHRYRGDLFLSLPLSNDVINLSDNSVFSWNFGELTNTTETVEQLRNTVLRASRSGRDSHFHDLSYDWVKEGHLNYFILRSFQTKRYKITHLLLANYSIRFVYYDKKTGETFVFETTKEGIHLSPTYFHGESIIVRVWAHEQIGNPHLVRYNFKQ